MAKNRNQNTIPAYTENFTITDVVKEIRDVKNVLYLLLNRLEAVLRIVGRDAAK